MCDTMGKLFENYAIFAKNSDVIAQNQLNFTFLERSAAKINIEIIVICEEILKFE